MILLDYFVARSRLDPDTGCLVWQGAKNARGYGVCRIRGITGLAHRFAFEAAGNALPGRPTLLRHTCDNRACVNPQHLLPGSPQDNSDDMRIRGRHRHGAAHHNALLCETDVREIRYRAGIGENQAAIAKLFGVSGSVVSEIHIGKAWVHA